MQPLRLEGVAAEIQSAIGTDPVPQATANAILMHGHVWSTLQLAHAFPNLQEDVHNPSILPAAPAPPRGWNAELTINWQVAPKGSAYAAIADIPAHPLFRACGCAYAVDTTGGAEKIDFTQDESDFEVCTVYAWASGWLFKLLDCRGRFRWPVSPGLVDRVTFTMRGLVDPAAPPVETTLPASFTYPAVNPLTDTGIALTIGAYTPQKLISAEFDQGVEPAQQDDALAADGLAPFNYGAANPLFRCSIPAEHDGSYDPYADARARTSRAIAMSVNAGTQYERMLLVNTNAYVGDPGHVEDTEFAAWDLEHRMRDWILRFS